ncbi:MAG: hypothetical protein R6X27_14170 [Candidatus Desulfacyla sp.]
MGRAWRQVDVVSYRDRMNHFLRSRIEREAIYVRLGARWNNVHLTIARKRRLNMDT